MPSIASWASPKGASSAVESVTGPPLGVILVPSERQRIQNAPHPAQRFSALGLSGALICRLLDDSPVRATGTGRRSTRAAGRRLALRLAEGAYAGTAGATSAFRRRRWARRSRARYTTGVDRLAQ